MSRAYDDNQTLQQKIIAGANVLADNVASTLGPKGRNVLLKEKDKQPFITKDGVTVAEFVELQGPFQNWPAPYSENPKDLSHLVSPLSSYNVASIFLLGKW